MPNCPFARFPGLNQKSGYLDPRAFKSLGPLERSNRTIYVQLHARRFLDPRKASISKLIWPAISRPGTPENHHQSAAPARGVQALPAAASEAAPTHTA
jgi:hypothetical protein